MSVVRVTQDGPVVRVTQRSTPIRVVDRPTVVKTGSAMGLQGVRGIPGGSIPAIAFAYGDAPGIVWTTDTGGLLTVARIIVTTPFNGTTPSLVLGTLADPDAVMPSEYSDLTQESEFENTPDLRMAAGDSVRIAITPDGSTQGAGLILLTFNPD